jgi:hypothetical protein
MAESKSEKTLLEVSQHYDFWTEDNDNRRTRKFGWNDVTDAFWGKLPQDWPYIAKTVDPRIRTTLIEKNARLLNNKLRGRLVPREGSDVIKAAINNAILDYQWDCANFGGSMLSKWAITDMDTRLYGSCFGLVKWRHAEKNGKVVFDGNEFTPLDVRDCGFDPAMGHIRSAKWFQHRNFAFLEDLESENDLPSGKPKYPGLEKLKKAISDTKGQRPVSQRRDEAYERRVLQLKGLTDRAGEDDAFPMVEIVTEYRTDRWITFSPKHKVILRDIPNPYKHGNIPVIQLRYYRLSDDSFGESEVEPVLPLWRAIQATVCAYLDTMNVHMKPPLKVLDGQVRAETIQFAPDALWIMNRPDAITEFQHSGDALRFFQTTYSSLISAFNTAMGDLSQGVSSISPFEAEKTATEVKQTAKQQNTRDQNNQMYLAEALQDMMMMWLSNNQQFLFADPAKSDYIMRIVGGELFEQFKKMGLGDSEPTTESMGMIAQIIEGQGGEIDDQTLSGLLEAGNVPKYPFIENPMEKNPLKIRVKPKLEINESGTDGVLHVTPDDMNGHYDYVADAKSMSAGAAADLMAGKDNALKVLQDPQIGAMLAAEGFKPSVKDLLVSIFEEQGISDAQRFFTPLQPEATAGIGAAPSAGPAPALPQSGMPGTPDPLAALAG